MKIPNLNKNCAGNNRSGSLRGSLRGLSDLARNCMRRIAVKVILGNVSLDTWFYGGSGVSCISLTQEFQKKAGNYIS